MRTIRLGDLELEFRTSPNRRTLELTVDRGGELVVVAPSTCDVLDVEAFVKSRQEWIYRKLAEKSPLRPIVPPKEYVTGEGFLYLGRSYRLLLVDEQEVPVKLESGRFKMERSAAGLGQSHMKDWYSAHAQRWLETKVESLQHRIGVSPRAVKVRDLGYRWGSCSRDGTINFHWKSVLPPPRIVEYIVVHELVHLVEALHTDSFWRKVERAMPDFSQRKDWLAENGSVVAAV